MEDSPTLGYSGGVDLAFRASLGGRRAAHMGCTQEYGVYSAQKAEIRFDAGELKNGTTYFLRITYSKNSIQKDKLRLSIDEVEFFEFIPFDCGSWERFVKSHTYRVITPGNRIDDVH